MGANTVNVCRPEHRSLLALVMAMDPNARKAYVQLARMKVTDLHPDYMFTKNAQGSYDQVPDPGAWNGRIQISKNFSIGVTVIRRGDNEWSFHEC